MIGSFDNLLLISPAQQVAPFSGVNSFLYNYFSGGGIGYWFIFLVLAIGASIFIFYDSDKRSLRATAWRIGGIVCVLLVLPSAFFKFSVRQSQVDAYFEIEAQIDYLQTYQDTTDWRFLVEDLRTQLANDFPPLTGMVEPIMVLGVLGGVGAIALALGYYFSNQSASVQIPSGIPPIQYPAYEPPASSSRSPVSPIAEKKEMAAAWLVAKDGRNHQLYRHQTTLGRSSSNDIQIIDDKTVSKSHAKIIEENNHFRIYDLGSVNGTRVNNRLVRQPVLLAPDDEIQLGDNTVLRFVTSGQ